ncbi:Uncharacterised protein [Mycobacteroides abscessus subsp. abscessus]|nr:Uncharacterised protein [Mycobacteroides abscessus subsp. abscessus]
MLTVAPSARNRATNASVSAPLPPTARPGGSVCMSAANPTIGAVPGSDIGGPDCAPNQASAAFSRSSRNQLSSKASPDCRNSRESALPPAPVSSPQNERSRCGGRGGAPNARMTRALRGPHTPTKRR